MNVRRNGQSKNAQTLQLAEHRMVEMMMSDDSAGVADLDANPGRPGRKPMHARADDEGRSLRIECASSVGSTQAMLMPASSPLRHGGEG
jgi:nitrate/nitrite-specific signal transduction histidine kinase